MGSDDLHLKRRLEANRSLARSKKRRESYDLVLIICEGQKTEPFYLGGLLEELQLRNIKIKGVGKDPLSIVNHALEEFRKNKDYDRIYCVFDKDEHHSYQDAIKKISSCCGKKTNKISIHGITSVPCFEYWLLLHFIDTTKPYAKAGNKSAGDQLLAELRGHIPNYKKGHGNIFNLTRKNLQIALNRAKKIEILQEKNNTENPTTKFYQLVEYLMSVKK